MNLKMISELTVEAFMLDDEEYFYVIADLLSEVGDDYNAARFRNGNWTERDKKEAFDFLYADLIKTIKEDTGIKFVEAVREANKHPHLISYLCKEVSAIRKERIEACINEIKFSRLYGKAARALMYIFYPLNADRERWITCMYGECVNNGFWKEAARWRKLGKSYWAWKKYVRKAI